VELGKFAAVSHRIWQTDLWNFEKFVTETVVPGDTR